MMMVMIMMMPSQPVGTLYHAVGMHAAILKGAKDVTTRRGGGFFSGCGSHVCVCVCVCMCMCLDSLAMCLVKPTPSDLTTSHPVMHGIHIDTDRKKKYSSALPGPNGKPGEIRASTNISTGGGL